MSYSEPTIALEDIAKKLGIAVSTVSRALRDLPGIHPATRAKVMDEAKSLGYVAPRKRNEASSQPRNILTLSLSGELPSAYLSGMSRASLSFNFSLLSYSYSHLESRNILDPAHQPPSLRMGLVAGIILIYKWPDDVVRALCKKWPTLSLVVQYPGIPIDLIGIDHVNGVFFLVKHLQETGHNRIGFFGLNPDASWSRSRFAAYVEALVSLRLPFHFEDTVQIEDVHAMATFPYPDETVFDQVIKKIKEGVRAWICADDVIGHSLCAGLIQRGIRIPEDVSVTGFHQKEFPLVHLPQLTTIKVKEDLLGVAALRRLAHRLDHPNESPRVILMPCELLKGETTLPVTKKAAHASAPSVEALV